ncbi:MAG: glutathione binding-like protein, partial [Halieaceae bacterium]
AYQTAGGDPDVDNLMMTTTLRREAGLYEAIETRLGKADYLAGSEFSCADIMSVFNLTSLTGLGARVIDDSMPNTKAYVERVTARPAYQKAMEIAGPEATRPG